MPHPSASDITGINVTVGVPGLANYSSFTAVSEIALPDGTSYKFSYDTLYGTISLITFPTGGYVRFCWAVRDLDWALTGQGQPTSSIVVTDAFTAIASGGFQIASTIGCDPSTRTGFQMTQSYVLGPSGEELSVLDGSNNWQRTNVYAGRALVGTYDSLGLHFHLTDPLGTRRMQLSGNPNSVGQPETDIQSLPYGDQLYSFADQYAPTTADDATALHFTGKQRDTESGNDYFGARYYASSMGRFMSPDWDSSPVAIPYADRTNPQSFNLYSYVGSNPLSRTDPDGHCTNGGQQKGFIWCFFNDSDQDADLARANLAAYKNISINGKTPSDAAKGLSNTQTVNLDRNVFDYISSQAMSSPGMMIGLAIVPGGAEEVVGREIGAIDVAGVGLGITGKIAVETVSERLAIEAAQSAPASGKVLQTVLKDSRFPASEGWVKMESRSPGEVVVHWVRNIITGAATDFKLIK